MNVTTFKKKLFTFAPNAEFLFAVIFFVIAFPAFSSDSSAETIRKHILGMEKLSGEDFNARDLNDDGKIDAADAIAFLETLPTPTPTPAPDSLFRISRHLFGAGHNVSYNSRSYLEILVESVWIARDLSDQSYVFSGTITQSENDPDIWTYSTEPDDKFIVFFSSGKKLEFIITRFHGVMTGGTQEFLHQHWVDFSVNPGNQLYLDIESKSILDDPEPNDRELRFYQEKLITGSFQFYGANLSPDIRLITIKNGYEDYPYHSWIYNTKSTGSVSATYGTLDIDETYYKKYLLDVRDQHEAWEFKITNDSSVVSGNDQYSCQGAWVKWEKESIRGEEITRENVVVRADYWDCGGALSKNSITIGSLKFSGDIIQFTHGPDLVLKISDNVQHLLHPLIEE